jgi:transcriptional regulator with XRE-family HTH domain
MEIGEILNELCVEDGRSAKDIAAAANISQQLLTSYRRNTDRSQPWMRLEKVLDVLGYELDVVKKEMSEKGASDGNE